MVLNVLRLVFLAEGTKHFLLRRTLLLSRVRTRGWLTFGTAPGIVARLARIPPSYPCRRRALLRVHLLPIHLLLGLLALPLIFHEGLDHLQLRSPLLFLDQPMIYILVDFTRQKKSSLLTVGKT